MDLPPEIWKIVFSKIYMKSDLQTIRMVCTQWRDYATEFVERIDYPEIRDCPIKFVSLFPNSLRSPRIVCYSWEEIFLFLRCKHYQLVHLTVKLREKSSDETIGLELARFFNEFLMTGRSLHTMRIDISIVLANSSGAARAKIFQIYNRIVRYDDSFGLHINPVLNVLKNEIVGWGRNNLQELVNTTQEYPKLGIIKIHPAEAHPAEAHPSTDNYGFLAQLIYKFSQIQTIVYAKYNGIYSWMDVYKVANGVEIMMTNPFLISRQFRLLVPLRFYMIGIIKDQFPGLTEIGIFDETNSLTLSDLQNLQNKYKFRRIVVYTKNTKLLSSWVRFGWWFQTKSIFESIIITL